MIRLSTTTSVNDSGLLGSLLPVFEEKYGYTVEVQSAGTGKAIAAAESGNADLILVSESEEVRGEKDLPTQRSKDLVEVSFTTTATASCSTVHRDPAKVADCETATDAFKAIADGKFKFISRGDGSGTHLRRNFPRGPKNSGIT